MKKRNKREELLADASGVTDGSDSEERDREEKDQRTMTQCPRTDDNRRGNREGSEGEG